jgi:hypothetical protein
MNKKNKIVFAIFTCNRLYYFKNAFESLCSCVDLDRVKILIIDNNTTENGFDEYLNHISSKYGDKIIIKRFTQRVVGEIYRAMNWAIKWCMKEKREIIYFMQDDYQFLFSNDNAFDDVIRIFKKNPSIVQAHINLVWKRKHKKIGKYNVLNVHGTNYALLQDKGPCDNGFTRVGIYSRIGFYPDNSSFKSGDSKNMVGERWFGKKCSKKGWKRVISLYPNVGMMFSSAFVRGGRRYGDYFKPPNAYYIKMFNKSDISNIKSRHDKKKWCFIEDLCHSDGWKPTISYKRDDNTDIINDISLEARDY